MWRSIFRSTSRCIFINPQFRASAKPVPVPSFDRRLKDVGRLDEGSGNQSSRHRVQMIELWLGRWPQVSTVTNELARFMRHNEYANMNMQTWTFGPNLWRWWWKLFCKCNFQYFLFILVGYWLNLNPPRIFPANRPDLLKQLHKYCRNKAVKMLCNNLIELLSFPIECKLKHPRPELKKRYFVVFSNVRSSHLTVESCARSAYTARMLPSAARILTTVVRWL